MIEVELRGRLTEQQYGKFKTFLAENARHIDSHEREMFLLRDYEGYSDDPMARELDIRLRNSSGRCEIMMKRKVGENNISREEISIGLPGTDWENAKQLVKAFGCKTAIRMHRIKDTYGYNNIEWSVVKAPQGIYYFEGEQIVTGESEVALAREYIAAQAVILGLTVFTLEQTREFLQYLDKNVNEEVAL